MGRLALALMLALALWTQPAQAFSLFGVTLFGSDDAAEEAGIVDPVAYTAVLAVEGGDADLTSTLRDASLLIGKQDQPPSGLVGLLARANDDRSNLVAQLYEEARFGAVVAIAIDGRRLEDISVTEEAPAGHRYSVTITVTLGPAFTFGTIRIDEGEAARAAAAEAGLVAGAAASTRTILAAETAIAEWWQKQGHPYAAVSGHEVVADHATQTVDVAIAVSPGPAAVLGGVTVAGAKRLDPDFLVRQADVPEGVAYHPDILERARKNLAKLEALASVSVRAADKIGADGRVPVIVDVAERKPRTIGASVDYSSTEGVGGTAYWMHRNLFGEAETLRLEAEIGQLLEADTADDYEARFATLFGKPGVLDPYTRLDLKATVLQEDPQPYNRRGAVFEELLTHNFTDRLSLSGGIAYDWSRIDDGFGRNYYSLFALPAIGQYDGRDNLLDPAAGALARLRLEPQFELDSNSLFFTADAELRLYQALDDDKRFVIAARGLVGATYGAGLEEIPAHRRFYAGGGGSVRGYEYLNIGPRIEGFGATGGLARIEGSLEARIKVTETIGVVPFVDAGLVTETPEFGGDDQFKVGVGLGLRYFTSVGPLRLDVAFPLAPGKTDPDFAVCFGIGQAF